MKIIRWFLSHFFLILLIVVVIYGYMFWGNLAGEKTPAGKALAYLSSEFVEVDEFVNAVKAKQAQLSAEQVPAVAQQSSGNEVDTLPETNPDAKSGIRNDKQVVALAPEEDKTPVVSANITQQPVSISYSHNQMRVKQSSDGEIESRPEISTQSEVAIASSESNTHVEPVTKPESEPASAPPIQQKDVAEENMPPLGAEPAPVIKETVKTAGNFVSPKVEQQLNNVDKNGKVVSPALKTYAIRDSWIIARKSFYQRKYKLSEQSYRDVINNTTDNFDAYGELGNVYFNQGKNAEAAEAYFEAASILVRKGQVRRARSLMGLLRHLDDSKATDLRKLIDSATS